MAAKIQLEARAGTIDDHPNANPRGIAEGADTKGGHNASHGPSAVGRPTKSPPRSGGAIEVKRHGLGANRVDSLRIQPMEGVI